ncbi:MAG: hypothetical protein R6X12_04735, partial [bacterium]
MVLLLAAGVMTGQERQWAVVRRYQLSQPPSLKTYLVPNNSWAITRATGHIVTARTYGTNTVWIDRIPIGGGQPSSTSLSSGVDAVVRDVSIARVPHCPSTLAFVVKLDNEVYIRRSINSGANWSPEFKVSGEYSGGLEHVTVRHPSLAVDSAHYKSRAEVAWADSFPSIGWCTYTRYVNMDGEWTDSVPPRMLLKCAQWGVPGGGADYPSVGGRLGETYRLVASEFVRGAGPDYREIMFRGSEGGGSTAHYVTDNVVPDARPSLAWRNLPSGTADTTYIAYQQQMTDGSFEVKLSHAHEDNPSNWFHTTPCSTWQRNNFLKFGDVRHPSLWCSGPSSSSADTLYMVMVVGHLSDPGAKYLYFTSSDAGHIGYDWRTPSMISGITSDSVSICAHGDTAYAVYNRHHRWGQPESTRSFVVMLRLVQTRRLPQGEVDGNAGNRPLVQLQGGGLMFRALSTEDIVSAERSTDGGTTWFGMLTPGVGGSPSIAVGSDTVPCVIFTRADTVYCSWWSTDYQDWAEPVTVFIGAADAVPGPVSVALYPGLHDGVKVAAVTFAVYDPTAGSSLVLFAKADSGRVLLDTVATANSLADSFPQVVLCGDSTAYVVWQSYGQVLSRQKDFDPSCWTAHGSDWGSSIALSASGARPSLSAEDGIIHAVWREVEDTGMEDLYVIRSKSCDHAGVQWTGWQDDGSASATDNREKDWPGYAGAGVTYWLERVSGVWNVLARVRGDTVTLVDTDANSYLPSAVAESSAVSPSVNQVRVKLHWAEELPSDSCEYRFGVCSLNVSSAGSNATGQNNGVKLIRKDGSDSLFAVYSDVNGSLMYARSAGGGAWTRTALGSDAAEPALAADSTGRQWVASRYVGMAGAPRVELVYRDGAGWSGSCPVYVTSPGSSGPVSVAGASDGTDPCVWAAFLLNSGAPTGPSRFVVVAKADGAKLFLDTLASGGSELGDPSIATELAGGGDYVHVCWEDDGEVRYTRTTAAIAAGAWDGGLAVDWEAAVDLSESPAAASAHPVVGADRD